MSHVARALPLARPVGTALVLVALLLARTGSAAAWDPFGDQTPDPGPVTPPDPAPYVIPDGVYLVTDVYTGDVVTTSGDTTTYSTTTTRETPGTYARVIDVVGTGGDSAYDGASFNGRARLDDGRRVGGTYYEDFVLTAGGLVSVNVVFFQDDSETRTSEVGSAPVQTRTATSATQSGSSVTAPPNDGASRAPASARPVDEPASPPTPRVAAAVALAPLGPSLDAIEVLRGRSVRLFLRATSDGVAAPVRTWRLVGGSADVLSRREGGGADPCDALWLTLPAPGTVWTLRFEVTSDLVLGQTLAATLRVAVRSPALDE
jgi:hypothetical protein